MYRPIPVDATVNAGDKLQFKFSFFDLLYIVKPTESDIADAANQAASFNVIRAQYDLIPHLFGESGSIEGVATETTSPNQIADDIRHSLSNFKTIKGITINEIDKDDGSVPPSATSVPTAITTASIAIIIVVLGVLVLKFT